MEPAITDSMSCKVYRKPTDRDANIKVLYRNLIDSGTDVTDPSNPRWLSRTEIDTIVDPEVQANMARDFASSGEGLYCIVIETPSKKYSFMMKRVAEKLSG